MDGSSLARQTLAAIFWSYAGVAANICVQVAANIAYARLLGPDQFGLFASGMLVTGILKVIGDLGLGSALTQCEILDARAVRSVFTRLMLAGAAACLILVAVSRPLALSLKDLRLVPVYRCFALALLCFPFATVCTSLLDRKLDQRRSQIANLSSYALGYFGLGLTAAMFGLGAWSPIIGFFAQLLIKAAMLWAYTRADLRPLWDRKIDSLALTQFGLRVMLTNVSNWLIYSMDNFLVQRFFGTRRFGIYTVAYNIVRTPTEHLVLTLQNVLLPASARIKNDKERLQGSYVAALDAVLTVTIPLFSTVAVLSTTFVEALYGSKWRGAESVLAPLALAMPFQAVTTVTSSLLWGTGFVGKELRIQWLCAPVLFVTIVVCAQFSFVAVAWGVFGVYLLRAALIGSSFGRLVGLSIRHAQVAGRAGCVLALVSAPTMLALDALLRGFNPNPLGNLITEGVAAGALWLALLVVTRGRLLSPELQSLATGARAELSAGLQRRRRPRAQ